MGSQRFFAILNNIGPNEDDLQEIVALLNNSFCECIQLGTFVCFDETVWCYLVNKYILKREEKKQQPIPVVFIPRKPKPNGLMTYKLVTKLSKSGKTFILVFVVHSKIPQITPTEAMMKAVAIIRNHFNHQLHITGDSAFGSFKNIENLKQMNVLSTFSMCSSDSKWIWNLLKRKLYQDNWKAFDKNDTMVSVFHNPNEEDTHRYHHLATNLFETNSKGYDLSSDGNLKYSKSYLESKTVKKLKEICVKEQIKSGKLIKQRLIAKIMDICNGSDLKLKDFVHDIDTCQFKNTPVHHDLYRETFNLVDKQNKYYYKSYYAYSIHNWRVKLFISYMTDVFYNLFAIYSESKKIGYGNFRMKLADLFHELSNE